MLDWIIWALESTGYVGVALLMLGENVFPPIPSELIMPLAGFAAARGSLSYTGVIIAGTIGSLAGAYFWYEIGRRVGHDRLKAWAGRHGRWLTMTPGEVDRAADWFRRHGAIAVLIGRVVPGVRTLISVPAGVAGMRRSRFLLWSGLGTVAWVGILVAAGALLESQYQRIEGWIDPLTTALFVAFALYYVYRLVTFEQKPA